ncbi:Reverse transcriptase [Phytophthora palmivora]|uniref:Reverse transcriptase n=1 Tax=Phytophthora palmivora TaxID=4796 RepID=A0A2P4XGI1_9STRA|nr:Reverse transcriptase [Phytophthora palmivora]
MQPEDRNSLQMEDRKELCEADQVCIHEGGDLFAEDVESQMAVLPEVVTTTEEVTIDDLQVVDPEVNTPEEIYRLRQIIWKRAHLLIGKGNALPPAALGAICDIDVGEGTLIAQRSRRVAPQLWEKLSDLIKGLLSATIITHSTSPWASPIVVIIKRNGDDIRLCIDYRLVNSLSKLMVYPMPLINDLLEDLDKVLWYCSLDMASGFWVVSMTERARKISAFITPFGLFEWTRMPFGLKNAPHIYQRLVDNALYGHLRIGPGHRNEGARDVFTEGEPDPESGPSVLGRRSYIDDILVTAISWSDLCEKVEKLLDACDSWNLSISVVKSSWGYRKVTYLGHQVSANGLEASPKDLENLANLPFPQTLRAMQSFLGSLNYYSRFIEDFAVYAAVLYELRESDFHELRRANKVNSAGLEPEGDPTKANEGNRWTNAKIIVLYANKWAISAALMQEYDGVYWPVTFTSRTLKSNEINYGIVDKEVLALLRILDTLKIMKCVRGEEEILGAIAASITPRDKVDEALVAIAPRKQQRKNLSTPLPMIRPEEALLVASFDGSARTKRKGGAFSAIIWKLPEWSILEVMSDYSEDLTVNEAEDRGRVVICGDSNLVIRQMRGEIDCWNQIAERLASAALQRQEGEIVTTEEDREDLMTLNRLDELLRPKPPEVVVHVSAMTRQRNGSRPRPTILAENIVQHIRCERIRTAQDEEKWIPGLKAYVQGDVMNLTADEAKGCSKIASEYEVDEANLLLFCPRRMSRDDDRDGVIKLVVPKRLQQDFLHHYHSSIEGGHQGIGRTYQRVESPGNIQGTYPFQVISMDHIPSLPRSFKANTELLIWADVFSGYVIAKASSSREAQTIAENYEECVFSRFGASQVIRHDREPGFMSDFFGHSTAW